MMWGLRSTILAVVTASALIGASAGGARTPIAGVASACSVGSGTGYGYTYVTSLNVYRTSCGTGQKLVHKHGNVRGWGCHKQRLSTSSIQYQDRETCTNGSRKVVWTFTQNT